MMKTTNVIEAPTLKYGILKRLKAMPGTYRTNYYLLIVHLGITNRALDGWMKITSDQKRSIPVDHFYMIADFLNCNPTDLLNK